MEEFSLVWLLAGFVFVIALRNIALRLLSKRAVVDDYAKDVQDILTKDEHRVKGRFE